MKVMSQGEDNTNKRQHVIMVLIIINLTGDVFLLKVASQQRY